MDCLIWADAWLEEYAADELATVVHEDGVSGKPMIRELLRIIRSEQLMERAGFPDDLKQRFKLPLRRIIDTVHFAEKADARPLQLADLCAFIFARALKDLPVPTYAFEVVVRHMRWVLKKFSEYAKIGPPISLEDSQ
jgi:hypothetical protein